MRFKVEVEKERWCARCARAPLPTVAQDNEVPTNDNTRGREPPPLRGLCKRHEVRVFLHGCLFLLMNYHKLVVFYTK